MVKIVLIMHNKCSQADIAYTYVNRSKAQLRTRTNLAHYLVKIVLIMHNKCSQADTAHTYVNRSKAQLRTRTNLAHSNKQMAERTHHI